MKKHPLFAAVPAAVAVAIGSLVPAPVASAERIWDVAAFDTCMRAVAKRVEKGEITNQQAADEKRFCCEMSGGDWSKDAHGEFCGAPPATAQTLPKSPGEIMQAPNSGTAAPPQNPERTFGGTFEAVPIGPGGPVLYTP